LDGELRHLKEEAYRLKIQTEEKLSVGKDLTNEIEQLQTKIDRAKDINLVMQKSIRRTKKTKSKLSEEVSEPVLYLIFLLHGRWMLHFDYHYYIFLPLISDRF
jgi:hypothetical protein